MLEKSRLEELIKNKQPIYTQYDVIYPHRWKKGYDINEKWIQRRTFEMPQWYYNLSDLFETKEERDWFYKFVKNVKMQLCKCEKNWRKGNEN